MRYWTSLFAEPCCKHRVTVSIFVTIKDLINKPVQAKILLQSLYEDGLLWYEQMVIYGNNWISKFNDFTDFTSDFDSKIMIEWARDMEDIIEETMCKFRI